MGIQPNHHADSFRYRENADASDNNTRPRNTNLGNDLAAPRNVDSGPNPINVRSKSPGRGYSSPSSSMAGSPPDAPVRLVSGKNGGYRALPTSHPHDATPMPAVPQRNLAKQPSTSKLASASGGLQVTLGETGSWSELAKQDTTLPADAKELQGYSQKPNGGMLGFLSRKKGRGHSPKPQERGILGKEGARVIISEG
jgi:serine/threonine kinase 32